MMWQSPKLFGVGQFVEMRLYSIVLTIAKSFGYITIELLQQEIPERIKGLIVVNSISKRTYDDLIRELLYFDFLKRNRIDNIYSITDEGIQYLDMLAFEPNRAKDLLLKKTQEVFITPGWFVNRLWELNPDEQGQIVIPTPVRSSTVKLPSRLWDDYKWNAQVDTATEETYNQIKKVLPGSFPIEYDVWRDKVIAEYERLGTLKPKTRKRSPHFSSRKRLSLAMQNVSVKHFFSKINPLNGELELPDNKRSDMTHRAFMIWCPRLEYFNLLVYTDYLDAIPGRLVFPISKFKEIKTYSGYSEKLYIENPENQCLYIYHPSWKQIRATFITVLYNVYQKLYRDQWIIYVSIQDIRDEVCRQLRISPADFEDFLSKSYQCSLKREIEYSISLETDLRLDMKVQLNRRGVIVDKKMYTLIAIKQF